MAAVTMADVPFLDQTIDFSNGTSYELLIPLTDFRKCHDGTPLESRILFTCRRTTKTTVLSGGLDEEFVVKIKVQVPDEDNTGPQLEPSTTTAAELEALRLFRDSENANVPHLIDFKQAVQGPNGPFPGGYVTFTVMSKMPGKTLLDNNYWKLPAKEREDIQSRFLQALQSVYKLGIEPQDRALRNIMWEAETRKCSIIDFELWQKTEDTVSDHVKEFQRWGIARRPPPRDWWAEWNLQGR